MNSDEQSIRDVHSVWINAVNAGDLATLLTLMSDEAVFLSPGKEPTRCAEFSTNFTTAHQQARIHCSSELEEVVVVGEVAYTRSRDALSVSTRADQKTTNLRGYRMTVYRKQLSGQWLLARDSHTLSTVEK
jgi:uncharacterized protein (TIGR02246 family)